MASACASAWLVCGVASVKVKGGMERRYCVMMPLSVLLPVVVRRLSSDEDVRLCAGAVLARATGGDAPAAPPQAACPPGGAGDTVTVYSAV